MDMMALVNMTPEQMQATELLCREQLRAIRRVMKTQGIPVYSAKSTLGPVVRFTAYHGTEALTAIKALRAVGGPRMSLREAQDVLDAAKGGNALFNFKRKLTPDEVVSLAPYFTLANPK